MKKVLIGVIGSMLAPVMLHSQGTIAFSSRTVNHKVVYSSNTTQGPGPGWQAALYWGTQGSTEAQLIQIGAPVPVDSATGFLTTAATRTTGPSTPGGGVGTFQVRAWNDGFVTYEDAILHGLGTTQVGKTALFTNFTGDPEGVPPTPPAALTGWTSPLMVAPIPEPSTLALAGLGGICLLMIRQHKQKQN